MSKSVVITSATRTAVGSLGKALKNIPAEELGSVVIKEVIKRSNIKSSDIDETIMGQVLTGGTGQNPARQAAMKSGVPKEKPAYIVNQVCGSGLRSIASGFQSIKSGDSKIVIAGGQENMSLAPHAIHLRDGKKIGDTELVDTMIKDGLWDAFHGYHMGVTAENVATKFQVTRQEQDKFALKSQEKALKAIKENKFKDEITNFKIKSKKAEIDFNKDEHPRDGINLEGLTRLKPVFQKDGTVTAGNASGINDGAAAVTLMSEEEAKKRDIKKLVTIKSWASCGVEPALMGTGPIPATKKALEQAKLKPEDINLVEVNEAFSSVVGAWRKEFPEIDYESVNANGGSIAIGHPLGATGARLMTNLVHEMKRNNFRYGLQAICEGGGTANATIVELV